MPTPPPSNDPASAPRVIEAPAAAAGAPLVRPVPPPNVPSFPAPRVLELSPGEAIAPIKPVAPPAAPTVIPVDPVLPPLPGGGGRVVNIPYDRNRDTTGLLPNHPPGAAIPRPVPEVANDVRELLAKVQEPEAEINVPVGQTKLIETRRILTRVTIANTSVADVELLTDQPNSRLLNLYGRSFGMTNLTLWDTENRPVSFLVRVTLDTRDLESRIKQAYPGSLVQVRQVGAQVILDGQVQDNKTMNDVLQLVQTELRYSGGLRLSSGGGMSGGGAGAMGGAGGGAGGAGGASAGGGAPMGGSSPMGGGGGMAGGGAGGMSGGLVIINRVHVPGPRQVLLKVKIAELNRDAIRELGVSWLNPRNNSILASTIGGAASIAGSTNPTQATTGFNGVVRPITSTFNSAAQAANSSSASLFGIFHAGQFSLFLDALRSNSMAKILAEPNLMSLDGQPAQFIAGGLFPYPVPQSSSIPGGTAVVTVQFAKFGAILTFLPMILPNDVIRLDVEPIFSQLNFGSGTTINGGRVPAIDQRSARTVVELREGQTLAIAGLLQTTTNASTIRVPGLGDLPVVGPLFSLNRTETVETELVVLVTPELVAPMEANEVPESPGDRIITPNDFEFYFLGRIEGKSGKDFRATVREMDTLDVMKHFRSENQWVVGPHGYCD